MARLTVFHMNQGAGSDSGVGGVCVYGSSSSKHGRCLSETKLQTSPCLAPFAPYFGQIKQLNQNLKSFYQVQMLLAAKPEEFLQPPPGLRLEEPSGPPLSLLLQPCTCCPLTPTPAPSRAFGPPGRLFRAGCPGLSARRSKRLPAFTCTFPPELPQAGRQGTRVSLPLQPTEPLLTPECSINRPNRKISSFCVASASAEYKCSPPQGSFLPSAGPFHLLVTLHVGFGSLLRVSLRPLC